MRDLLARILGNQNGWVREHRNAEVDEVQAVGENGERVYVLREGEARASYRVDRDGNVLSVEAT